VAADSKSQDARPVPASELVGDASCLSCHQQQKTYLLTAHHLTSRPAVRESIAGKFVGQNVLGTSNPELSFRMDATADGFKQTAIIGTPPDTISLTERFDIVIGSGRKGQTYLYWKGDQLLQLPVSYWTSLGSWVNSPGYTDGVLNFTRPISPRCVECHASRFESLDDTTVVNRYDKKNYVLGISCERCHGPGREHVSLQPQQATITSTRIQSSKPQAIVNPLKLARARQIEACALCHGGLGTSRAPAFSFVPGKTLGDYLTLRVPEPNEPVDVHGNQVALLERSRCFQASNMTCSTCHNVHTPQRDAASYSKTCLECHKVESCGEFRRRGPKIAENCVDCHMPRQTSNAVISIHKGARVQPQVRNHWIRVYRESAPAPAH
jgi:hypothetical protein